MAEWGQKSSYEPLLKSVASRAATSFAQLSLVREKICRKMMLLHEKALLMVRRMLKE